MSYGGAGKKRTDLNNISHMKKLFRLLTVAIFGFMLKLQAAPALTEAAARDYLKHGALVIDVRTVEEFQANHLTNGINIPLDELKVKLPRQVSDKSKVLLLHCRTGRRSGIAETQLREMGYTNAFNIGSFEQVQKIVTGTAR